MNLVIVATLTAVVLTLLSGVVYVDFLKKKMFGQQIRDCVPENHQQKSGTPTSGGVFIVLSATAAAIIGLVLAQEFSKSACIVLMTFVFYMFAGLTDDVLKITRRQNEGLTPRGKLFLQTATALLPAVYVYLSGNTALDFCGYSFDLGWFYPAFAIFLIVGVSNAVNLTDGLDGLASSNVMISMIACTIFALVSKQTDLAIISASAAGACGAFLYFNKFPAKVFMGDTGSLALGGLLGTLAVAGKFELWLIPIGFIYMGETLSVMLQVASYKLTGKRIFKMTPIHHHFELSGIKETGIVLMFSAVTFAFSAFATYLFITTKSVH